MKNQIFCIAILLITAIGVSAQTTNETVKKIQTAYIEAAEKAKLVESDDDQGEFGPLFVNELTLNSRNHQWRAVGIHQIKYKFFYKAVENDERRLYPDQLVLVKSERKESSRTYIEEYFFNERGELAYYFRLAENDDQSPERRLVYFSGLKTLRIIDDDMARDQFSAAEQKNIAQIKRTASMIKDLFVKSINL